MSKTLGHLFHTSENQKTIHKFLRIHYVQSVSINNLLWFNPTLKTRSYLIRAVAVKIILIIISVTAHHWLSQSASSAITPTQASPVASMACTTYITIGVIVALLEDTWVTMSTRHGSLTTLASSARGASSKKSIKMPPQSKVRKFSLQRRIIVFLPRLLGMVTHLPTPKPISRASSATPN